MMDRIALTSKGPYTGCSTLASHLAVYDGYKHINMSDILIQAFAEQHSITIETVKGNKAQYRKALQEFGDTSGFQSDPIWMERCLVGWDHIVPVVIEKVRTDSQARYLKDRGFKIVELTVQEAERERRAALFGVSKEQLALVMQHPCEQGICPCLVNVSFRPEISVNGYTRFLEGLTN